MAAAEEESDTKALQASSMFGHQGAEERTGREVPELCRDREQGDTWAWG